MGGAFVALSDDVTAVYWNPAGLSILSSREGLAQHAEQFGGTVNHDVLAVAIPLQSGGVGVGLVRVGVDGIRLSELEDPDRPAGPDNRPVVLDEVGTSEYHLYLGYGRLIHPRLRAGTSLKLIRRDLSAAVGYGYGIDLGVLYLLSDPLTVGLALRDVTRTRIAYGTGADDRIAPSAIFGLAYLAELPRLNSRLVLTASIGMGEDDPSQSLARRIRYGAEWVRRDQFSLRLGAEGGHFTAGAGLRFRTRFGVDFAFLDHDELDNAYRVSASVRF